MSSGVQTGSQKLWHLNFKINAGDVQQRGFNLGFKLANMVEADAKAAALKIATSVKAVMPSDAEIFYATISMDDTKKDSRFLPTALGVGTFVGPGVSPPPSKFDEARTCALIRLEDGIGGEVPMKIAPIPDAVVTAGGFVTTPAAVVGVPGTDPGDPVSTDAWDVTFNNLMQRIVMYCSHVVAGHAPGGTYTYYTYLNCYAMRPGKKRGGRVFI